jgi:tRNA (guanine37-N1)-methyltransferase
MHFDVITLFPELIRDVAKYGVLGRALDKGICSIDCWNPRDYCKDRYRTIDDRPYGGGPGMVMMIEPLVKAIRAARMQHKDQRKVIYLSPQGEKVSHRQFKDLNEAGLIFICGRYEGIDERLIQAEVDEQWSIGDYVLAGGELPAMVVIEAITRLQTGALGNDTSASQDSFSDDLLDCPQFTRPEQYNGVKVPEVLLSGNHREIDRWRLKQSLGRTSEKRPDLLESRKLTQLEKKLLDEYKQENRDL